MGVYIPPPVPGTRSPSGPQPTLLLTHHHLPYLQCAYLLLKQQKQMLHTSTACSCSFLLPLYDNERVSWLLPKHSLAHPEAEMSPYSTWLGL